MKSHRKYAKHVNLKTGLPFTSILDRFENDPIYRYRMMAAGWTADMMEPLQKLLETPILGDRQSYRTREQIRDATTSYTTHPELGEGHTSAGNPDWKRTKASRDEFRGGLVQARYGQPVAQQVAGLLQQHFGMDVPTVEDEETPGDGEGQPSADKGKGRGQGKWWSTWWSTSASTRWSTPTAAVSSSDWRSWTSGDDSGWRPGAAAWWQSTASGSTTSWWGDNDDQSRWK